jgi:hypothetical protein
MAFHAEPSSGHPMDFDDRRSNTGASPVETVLSAGYWVDVVGNQRDEYPQVYTEVFVTHELEGRDLSEAAIRRAIELSALKYCPVNAMISAGATTVHHRYKIRSEGTVDYAVEGEVISTGPYRRPDVIA